MFVFCRYVCICKYPIYSAAISQLNAFKMSLWLCLCFVGMFVFVRMYACLCCLILFGVKEHASGRGDIVKE
jgi:hypothetical protein